ncbi:MAG: hypothetical protein ACRDPA_15230 [Solirubrobacteraceae bacterium]
MIVTNNLQQAPPAADATAGVFDGELVERGPTTRMFTNPNDRTERDVTAKIG